MRAATRCGWAGLNRRSADMRTMDGTCVGEATKEIRPMGSTIYYISRPTKTDPLWHVHREGLHAMSFTDEATALQWATSHARAHASLHGGECTVLLQHDDDQWHAIGEPAAEPRRPAREYE
jgi:hypothetical protein